MDLTTGSDLRLAFLPFDGVYRRCLCYDSRDRALGGAVKDGAEF